MAEDTAEHRNVEERGSASEQNAEALFQRLVANRREFHNFLMSKLGDSSQS